MAVSFSSERTVALARASRASPRARGGGAASAAMDFGAMLEGFRFGADATPPRVRPRVAARAKEDPSRAGAEDDPDDADASSSWHVSESIEGDDASAERGEEGTSRPSAPARAPAPSLASSREDTSGRPRPSKRARDDVRVASRSPDDDDDVHDHDPPPPAATAGMTYGDAVDLDRATFANASALLNDGAKKKMKASFFLPRGHPARAAADPPPARWREVLDAIVRARKTAPPASVDAFHGFLLSLRGDPDARFQALVAALLSVQCRDAVALQATERLREALGGAITVDRVRRADVSAVERATRSCNFKTTKARYVRECADAIATAPEFRGRVPRDVPGLMRLPGVGPKLAHLVASVAFGEEEEEREEEDSGDKAGAKRAEERTTEGEEGGRRTETEAAAAGPSGTEAAGGDGTLRDGTTTVHRASSPRGATGFVVDTHARRVAARLGWTSGRDAASAERTRVRLESFIPRSEWNDASLALVGFGQIRCAPRNPRCDGCPVGARCPEFLKKEEDENDDGNGDGNGKGLSIKGEVPRDVEDLW